MSMQLREQVVGKVREYLTSLFINRIADIIVVWPETPGYTLVGVEGGAVKPALNAYVMQSSNTRRHGVIKMMERVDA